MSIDFVQMLQMENPADLPNEHYRALWLDLHGDWGGAHRVVQALNDPTAMWIHAYLHRKEPDIDNARYWYRGAGKPFPGSESFESEAGRILASLGG